MCINLIPKCQLANLAFWFLLVLIISNGDYVYRDVFDNFAACRRLETVFLMHYIIIIIIVRKQCCHLGLGVGTKVWDVIVFG